jgi:hypothetical protein
MQKSMLAAGAALVMALGLAGGAAAQDGPPEVSTKSPSDDAGTTAQQADPPGGYFAHWYDRVREAQASQPDWITPLATVTPRLEQEFRFDAGFQQAGNGAHLANYGMGKGLELIPTTSNEIILGVPPYEDRTVNKPAQGFGDDPVLLIKQRLLSANAQNGDYIVTAFFGVQAPTGATAFTNDAWVITPTIAAGKGWGRLDVQGTLGVGLPLAHEREIGKSILANLALQYHVGEFLWPELEVNATQWSGGLRDGKTQVFLTPGLVIGRFPIAGRTKAIVGLGYQVAVGPKLVTTPALTPIYDRQLIVTTRMSF